MVRSIQSPVRVLRALGTASLFTGVVLAVGANAGQAQVTSSLKFDYTLTPNIVSIESSSPTTSGTITYEGIGVPPSAPPPANSPFDGVTGIQFINPSTFSYTAVGSTATFGSFSSFWLIGSCLICQGQTGAQQVTVPDPAGTIPTGSILTLTSQGSTVVTLSGGPVPIRFGQNGSPGILVFDSLSLISASNTIGEGSGTITISMLQDTTGVPGPLPILGASTAFIFSRKLRRRVAVAQIAD
jgi:hypothetical protein